VASGGPGARAAVAGPGAPARQGWSVS